jgi:large subunit ribosomal protein L23
MAALFGKKKQVKRSSSPAPQVSEKETKGLSANKVGDAIVTTSPGVENRTTKEEKNEAATSIITMSSKENTARVLVRPRITEKATFGTGDSIYVFDVAPDSNKKQIKEAIKRVYSVEPVKVHVTKIAKKNTRSVRDGTKGVKGGGKKAYVYLKKGDTISVM